MTQEKKSKKQKKPLLKAAQTPEWASAKTMSRAATISITLVRFIKKGNATKQYPLGSCVSYCSWFQIWEIDGVRLKTLIKEWEEESDTYHETHIAEPLLSGADGETSIHTGGDFSALELFDAVDESIGTTPLLRYNSSTAARSRVCYDPSSFHHQLSFELEV